MALANSSENKYRGDTGLMLIGIFGGAVLVVNIVFVAVYVIKRRKPEQRETLSSYQWSTVISDGVLELFCDYLWNLFV